MRLTPKVRGAILRAWADRCAYCGARAEHIDHLFPRAKGGEDVLSNYVPACVRCNTSKSDLVIEEAFLGLLRAKIKSKEGQILRSLGVLSGEAAGRPRGRKRASTSVVRVDMNISMEAIKWTAEQPERQLIATSGPEMSDYNTGLIVLFPAQDAEAFSEYCRTVPVWSGMSGVTLVDRGVNRGFPRLLAHRLLPELARIAVELGCPSFEFDGQHPPQSAAACRPSASPYGLPLPREALERISRQMDNPTSHFIAVS